MSGQGAPEDLGELEQDRQTLRSDVERLEELEVTLRNGIEALRAELETTEEERSARRDLRAKARSQKAVLWTIVGSVGSMAAIALFLSWLWYIPAERFEGVVLASDGASPVRVGEPCSVSVSSAFLPYNAWAGVECGGVRLYGHDSSGYVSCASVNGRIERCEDGGPAASDGDPDFELSRDRASVGDRDWSVDIALVQGEDR